MKRTSLPILACLTALPLTAGPLRAQGLPVDDYRIDWPSGLSSITGPMTRVILGRFIDDGNTHGIVLRGGTPVMIYHPSAMNALFALNDSMWNDLVTVPADTGVDEIAYTNPFGLRITHYDEAAEALTASVFLAGGSWAGAGQLAGANVDADGRADVVGLSSSGHEIVTMLNTSSGWVAGPTLSFLAAVSSYAVGDYDRDGANEIAVVLPQKVKVYEFSGTQLAWFWHSGQAKVTAIPRQDGNVGDMGVMATDDVEAGQWRAYAFDTSGIQSGHDLKYDIGGTIRWIEPRSLHAAKVQGDTIDHLVIPARNHSGVFTLEVIPLMADPFAPEVGGYWSMTPSTALEDGVPAVGEMGVNGTPGAIVPLDDIDALYVVTPLLMIEATETLTADEFFNESAYVLAYDAESNLESTTLELMVSVDGAPEDTDSIQIILWQAAGPPEEPLDEEAFSNTIFPVTLPETELISLSLPLELEDCEWATATHYYVEARLLDGSPPFATTVAEFFCGFTLQTEVGDPDYATPLLALSTAYSPAEDIKSSQCGGGGNPTPVGAIVTLGRLPEFEPLPPDPK